MMTALSARRPSAGSVPGRRGACLAGRTPPAAFRLVLLDGFANRPTSLLISTAPPLPPGSGANLRRSGRACPSTQQLGHTTHGPALSRRGAGGPSPGRTTGRRRLPSDCPARRTTSPAPQCCPSSFPRGNGSSPIPANNQTVAGRVQRLPWHVRKRVWDPDVLGSGHGELPSPSV